MLQVMTDPGIARQGPVATVAGLVALAVALTVDSGSGVVAAAVLVAGPGDDGYGLVNQVLWILGAAAIGGGVGWGVAELFAPEATTIAVGSGIAVCGGLGATVRLLAFGEEQTAEPEEVAVGSETDDESVPGPQPVDLFDENPDPVVYFDDSGDGPVVRAVNDAFEDAFGVSAEAVENAGLGDALMVTDRVDDVVAATSEADPFDAVLTCETADETIPFRVRTTAITTGPSTRGYILYTPVERS